MLTALKLAAGQWRLLLLGGLLIAVVASFSRAETLEAELETSTVVNSGVSKTVAVQRKQLAEARAQNEANRQALAQMRERLAAASDNASTRRLEADAELTRLRQELIEARQDVHFAAWATTPVPNIAIEHLQAANQR